MNMTAFCDTAPCSLVEVDRRFRGNTHIRDVGLLQRHYTALYVSQIEIIFILVAVKNLKSYRLQT
jgi:hypothetical protein